MRTGRLSVWEDAARHLCNEPRLTRDAAIFLAEAGAMIIGSNNVALKQTPPSDPKNWHPVHTFLLAEAEVPIMEIVNLEEIGAAGL